MKSTINNKIDWDNSSNASIKMELESLKHQQKTVVDKIVTLSKNLEGWEQRAEKVIKAMTPKVK